MLSELNWFQTGSIFDFAAETGIFKGHLLIYQMLFSSSSLNFYSVASQLSHSHFNKFLRPVALYTVERKYSTTTVGKEQEAYTWCAESQKLKTEKRKPKAASLTFEGGCASRRGAARLCSSSISLALQVKFRL